MFVNVKNQIRNHEITQILTILFFVFFDSKHETLIDPEIPPPIR